MTDTKDYTKYTFEDDAKMEMSVKTYRDILDALAHLERNYKETAPMSYKCDAVQQAIKGVLQKIVSADNKVVITFQIFDYVQKLIRSVLDKEIVMLAPLKYDNVNKKTSRIVKNVPKGQDDKYEKAFNSERTAIVETQKYVTPEGQTVLNMLNSLQAMYIDNIDKGNAKKLDEVAEEKAVEMETV